MATSVASHVQWPCLPAPRKYQYLLLQPPTLPDQMHKRLCQRIAMPAGLRLNAPGRLTSADQLPLQTLSQRAGIVMNIRHQCVGQPEHQGAMEDISQFSSNIQSPLIQVAKGPKAQPLAAAGSLAAPVWYCGQAHKATTPLLATGNPRRPLVLHRDYLLPLPFDALQLAKTTPGKTSSPNSANCAVIS